MTIKARSFASPNTVLLAFDWTLGGSRNDFLGFAIKRKPGFFNANESWLPNRLSFDGAKKGIDLPSNENPIQKFMWWDARIDDKDRGKTFTYTIYPVVKISDKIESKDDIILYGNESKDLSVEIPFPESRGIGTYFNRAVVSSQAFEKKFAEDLKNGKTDRAFTWLANGLERAIPDFVNSIDRIDGAIYHLTDKEWIIPALQTLKKSLSLVYHKKTNSEDVGYRVTEEQLTEAELKPRTRAKIMHNKFLVGQKNGTEISVLTGSANFSTSGLTTQANVLHTFKSKALAKLFLERKELLAQDPTLAKINDNASWSNPITVDDATVRVFFSPEKKPKRESIDTVVDAVTHARQSVLFCLFSPTDAILRRAIFKAGDDGKMMFGLINKIPRVLNDTGKTDASAVATVELYHRSRNNKDCVAHSLYANNLHPLGFWWERANLPGFECDWPVYIHHKFIAIDTETDSPVIYTGSANMSGSSLYNNDETLLEIKGSRSLGAIYLTEFLRLYEHYRARKTYDDYVAKKYPDYKLAKDASWCKKHYTLGTPESKSRISMVKE